MNLLIRTLDEGCLSDVDKCDTGFVSTERLMVSAENGMIRYEVVPMRAREKRYPPEPKEYREYLTDPNKVIFLAYADNELAGQIRLLKWWNSYAYVDDLAVETRFRKHGVGRALMERGIEWARTKGFFGVMLETQDINAAACRLYDRCGFELGGFDRNVYKALNPTTNEVALYWYLIFPSSTT